MQHDNLSSDVIRIGLFASEVIESPSTKEKSLPEQLIMLSTKLC